VWSELNEGGGMQKNRPELAIIDRNEHVKRRHNLPWQSTKRGKTFFNFFKFS
jgi:hypothetical protein